LKTGQKIIGFIPELVGSSEVGQRSRKPQDFFKKMNATKKKPKNDQEDYKPFEDTKKRNDKKGRLG